MRTILVPTDFSKSAANALHYALELAARTGASVVVQHIVYPNEGVDNNVYNAFWSEEYLAQRQKSLSEWTRRQKKKPAFAEVQIQTDITVGFPVTGIAEAAEKYAADLIVMATTGASGIRGVFLGSVAAGVLAKVNLPTLVVPQKAGYRPTHQYVLATDYRFHVDDKSLDVLRILPEIRQNKLRVVHVLSQPGELPDHNREQHLREKLEGFDMDFHYLHDRDVPQAISNFIEAVDADALIAIAHEHSLLHRLFYDSFTRRLAHRVRVPVLVLHDHA